MVGNSSAQKKQYSVLVCSWSERRRRAAVFETIIPAVPNPTESSVQPFSQHSTNGQNPTLARTVELQGPCVDRILCTAPHRSPATPTPGWTTLPPGPCAMSPVCQNQPVTGGL